MYPRAHLHNQLQAEKFSFFHVLNKKCESVSVNGHKATFSAFQTSPTTPCRTTGLRSSRTGATALQLFLFHSLPSAWPVESTSGACSPFPYISLWSVPKKKLTKVLLSYPSRYKPDDVKTNKQTSKQLIGMRWHSYFLLFCITGMFENGFKQELLVSHSPFSSDMRRYQAWDF